MEHFCTSAAYTSIALCAARIVILFHLIDYETGYLQTQRLGEIKQPAKFLPQQVAKTEWKRSCVKVHLSPLQGETK